MKRILKWGLLVILLIAAGGFVAFLYFIPPLTIIAPEEFIRSASASTPLVDGIADPAERLIAERGRYIVQTYDCAGCHTTQDAKGPRADMFLAGGMKFVTNNYGAVTSRNLTPDKETGLGGRSDDEIKWVLKSGVFHTGRAMSPRSMPWSTYSNFTDEDVHAIITYLRHIPPVRHAIPDPVPDSSASGLIAGATEVAFPRGGGK